MTIMFYLEKPEEGGETAFPAADNITYNEAVCFFNYDVGMIQPAETLNNVFMSLTFFFFLCINSMISESHSTVQISTV